MRYLHIISLFLCFSLLTFANEFSEFRGLWITRFEWPSEDPKVCRQNIIKAFEDMQKANFNAAFFQVRGEADVLYRSEIEPFSELIGGKDLGFDPLEFAIEQAHKRGIQLHAYINPIPLRLWKDKTPPKNPKHIFYRHGPTSENSWVCMDENGKIMDPQQAAYYYFSIGIPQVQVYLRKVIRDLVTRYDIDGLHLDRIRYPGPSYSHDPISKKRFLGMGNPNHKDWGDWQREQLNKFVNDVYAEVKAIKPQIIVSCAAWGIYNRHHTPGYHEFSSGYHDYYQDTWHWLKSGTMDLLIPMIYWDMPDPKPNYHELFEDFSKGVGVDRFLGGQRMYGQWQVVENIAQIRYSRTKKSAGTVIFSYSSAREKKAFTLLKNTVFRQKVATAKLPKRQTGIVLGTVVDSKGIPVSDAWTSLKHYKQKWTSGADGRFAFVNIPPGKATIVVQYHKTKVEQEIQIQSGATKKIKITIPETKNQVFFHILKTIVRNKEQLIHLLGKTQPGNKITINDQPTKVYPTGIFARDNIAAEIGTNKIKITASFGKWSTTRSINVELKTPAPAIFKNKPKIKKTIIAPSRIGKIIVRGAAITYGLHYVRLDGPFISEAPKDSLVEIIGQKQSFYQIRLSNSLSGWIATKNVVLLPKETPVPHTFFTYCIIDGDHKADRVFVPITKKIIYSISSKTSPQNSLIVDFFATHNATTWFSHKNRAKIVGKVFSEQIEDNHVRLHIPIKSKQIWGFWVRQNAKGITIFIKHPPKIDKKAPFKGLTIALEAGHGGSNLGAIGLSSTKEKDVNLKAVEILQQQLEKLQATVVLTRFRDDNPSHQKRLEKAIENNADFLISIHANATSTERGFLRVSGTSTYYKYAHCYKAAKKVYDRLLGLGWNEYGVVGNFNYYPLRDTQIPAILVEQGFMSHPFDESQLLDKKYLEKQAEAIIKGMEDFLLEVGE